MSAQSLYAMYVIGQVESNHNWTAINPSDPITLGMMQWYGNRAKSLILRGKGSDAAGYAQYFASTDAAKAAEADQDMSYYYVTQADANAWHAWAATDPNHAVQQAQWEDDFTAYQQVCDSHGFPSGNMRERTFFMTMYHQSPVSAFRVLGSTSGTANLDLLHSTALNDGVLGQYRNRYDTAYTMLKSWDGQSAPPDFGQVGDAPTPGGDTGSGGIITPTPAQQRYISLVGDVLVLHDNGKTYQFYQTAQQVWTNSGTAGTPISGGQTDTGNDSGSDAGAKVVAWVAARVGKYAYSQGPGRLDPEASGYTDCSGLWWRAYQDVTGINAGRWTGEQAGLGTRIAISGTDSPQSAVAKSKPGDLLLLTWSGHNPNYDHVEGMTGTGKDQTLSHGGPGNGPNYFQATTEMGMASEWELRRYV
jgi:cell wall-associated NlpC family hydrolase